MLRRVLFASLILCAAETVLEAGGWGSQGEAFEQAGEQWKEVYFDMNDLYFTANIPNYSGTSLSGAIVRINGVDSEEATYCIITPFNKGFDAPKSSEAFIEMLESAFTDFTITEIDGKPFGAIFAADLLSNESNEAWRILIIDAHFLKLGTNTTDEEKRALFFESILIQ
jgi:hypothetical protein